MLADLDAAAQMFDEVAVDLGRDGVYGFVEQMSICDSGACAAMRGASGPDEARQAAPAAARRKLLRLWMFRMIYFASICSTLSKR